MFAQISGLGLFGLNAFQVDVEIDISRGQPQFDIVGLPDVAVKESRDRIRAAMRSCDIAFPVASVMINLAPADTKKSGSSHDLAMFMAILCAMRMVNDIPRDCAFVGELSLGGGVRHVPGVLPMVMLAREKGIKKVFVPAGNALEASVLNDIEIYPVNNVSELIDHFRGVKKLTPCKQYIPSAAAYDDPLDFADVKGQPVAKKALEIAAAGGHNALLIGTPGCGKSMLAKRMPSILPPLSFEEALETTKIHSICNMLTNEEPIVTRRPFRAPHRSISQVGFIGGGSIPHPGEISKAHNGLLFLDEIAEFDKYNIEQLRQPLEDSSITIVRSSGSVSYPCKIMLIGAMNPCPCGYYGHPTRKCTCTTKKILAYRSKISGPIMDRIDLHIELSPVTYSDLRSDKKEESSAEVRKRVIAAREIQAERFKGTSIVCNAHIPAGKIHQWCKITSEADDLLRSIYERLNISARSHDKILKVARTIADLENAEIIGRKHIAAAVQFRSLDRDIMSE